MNGWEKLKILSAAFVPAVIALVGYWYTSAISEREVQAKFVELGVTILQAPPTTAATNLREWATEVLNRYSGVPLDKATRNDLIENIPLPSISTTLNENPAKIYCTCRAEQTFCFLEESDCQALTATKCVVKFTTVNSFNVSDTSKWSKYGKGWMSNKCAI
jgi:hypothetical protein